MGAHLAERRPVGPDEEPADERFADPVPRAPRLEAFLAGQHRHPDLGAVRVVARDVDRGPGTPAEEEAPAA